jgi:hypothetical protein
MERPQKIASAEMRASGVRRLLIYCANYSRGHYIAISADRWPTMMFTCLISSPSSFARHAAVPTCGRIFIGTCRGRSIEVTYEPRRCPLSSYV